MMITLWKTLTKLSKSDKRENGTAVNISFVEAETFELIQEKGEAPV
ncbi:MAG: hypothetical protein L0K95_00405 [Tetragenococcus koreensis]|nr:hypothetical protein [Tetragenococcus koreensis]MCF1656030.1 hypothetical protein [Tetragenococcus koreensis]MDN6578215.1 hypothetical protein [Tetragenococcus koreensis]